jgi:hypothetical protein
MRWLLRALWTGGWGVPVALVAIAALAFAGAYAASSVNSKDGEGARKAADAGAAVVFSGTMQSERGPDGLEWTWIGNFAVMSANGNGRYWLGVKAASLRQPRVLEFEDETGKKRLTGQIGVTPQLYVLGPLTLSGALKLGMRPRPRARTAGGPDRRRLVVFLSQPRLVRHPMVALPGQGFWSTENTSRGLPFNWLRNAGRIDLRAADENAPRAWLTFVAASSETPRTLSVRGGGLSETLKVPKLAAGSTGRRFTLGPIDLRAGQARISVSPRPGPRSVGADVRRLSVRISGLDALPSPSRTD